MENFRCFRERQDVRLAPLTLLVGENSTGKTSFLALIRALWDMAYDSRIPDFKEEPWDLGTFDEIAHHRGSRGSRAASFNVGVGLDSRNAGKSGATEYSFTLAKDGVAPVQQTRRISRSKRWIEETLPPTLPYGISVGIGNNEWRFEDDPEPQPFDRVGRVADPGWGIYWRVGPPFLRTSQEVIPAIGAQPLIKSDAIGLLKLALGSTRSIGRRPYASAPVRTKPQRTYDRSSYARDAEGENVPTVLADAKARGGAEWLAYKGGIEAFGAAAGLFTEFDINLLGATGGSGPFQVVVRKHGGGLKGPWRNLVDVGYGVSQVLPIVTDLLRSDAPEMFLLQQPEVHLHPSAQAALGTLFCQLAGSKKPGRQLIVETHSDYLIDRVRMDVRDGTTDLRPKDVTVLFFERDGLEANISPIKFDRLGNVVGAPPSYGRFFMDELSRDLWP